MELSRGSSNQPRVEYARAPDTVTSQPSDSSFAAYASASDSEK